MTSVVQPLYHHPASKKLVVNVAYFPSRVLKHSHFSFEPLFVELGLQKSPEIVVQLNKVSKVKSWKEVSKMRLPLLQFDILTISDTQ